MGKYLAESRSAKVRALRPKSFVVMAALALLALGLAPAPAPTEAAWLDQEMAAASFKARVIPAPEITTCTANRGLTGPSIVLTWKLPSGYQLANTRYWFANKAISNPSELSRTTSATTTGPSGGIYTTTYSGGLLDNLLGGSASVGLSLVGPVPWESKISYAVASFPALLGSRDCSFTNQ